MERPTNHERGLIALLAQMPRSLTRPGGMVTNDVTVVIATSPIVARCQTDRSLAADHGLMRGRRWGRGRERRGRWGRRGIVGRAPGAADKTGRQA